MQVSTHNCKQTKITWTAFRIQAINMQVSIDTRKTNRNHITSWTTFRMQTFNIRSSTDTQNTYRNHIMNGTSISYSNYADKHWHSNHKQKSHYGQHFKCRHFIHMDKHRLTRTNRIRYSRSPTRSYEFPICWPFPILSYISNYFFRHKDWARLATWKNQSIVYALWLTAPIFCKRIYSRS